ncbi:ferredoxin--NADP reductase [Comamonas sp. NLF-1-9]|uniref:ferredoxin--NADP reductase n=1 Tax=Comamonas sp. NLF-1-9 TaxID=2853163 RepID=UPI001C47C390|nr:FAD-dependent oxidoreductase [Comamonas sp. NLF-1-9]QXL83420.1 FAD-dependent oxidoreductase [Comamonas sp. NLF-1-9]
MTTQTVHLKSKNEVAQGTKAFHFDKPAGFTFRPGQALDLILSSAGADPNSSDVRHAFSIVSAPHEDELVVTTRMRASKFKNALDGLPLGAAVELDGPFGSLTLHKKTERAGVLIAGGIGVTPFMSMLRHAAHEGSAQPLRLLYSNRRPEDCAFLDELQQLERLNPHFKLLATMTEMEKSSQPWSGATGLVDAAFIRRAIEGLPAPVFYVSGPPAMVQAMREMLEQAGVDEDDVRSEEFYGY